MTSLVSRYKTTPIQFKPLTNLIVGGGGMRDNSAEILFPVFFAGGPREQLWHGQGRPLFEALHPAFPLPTTASPTLHSSLKDGFGEALVACGMPDTRHSASNNSNSTSAARDTRQSPHITPVPVNGSKRYFSTRERSPSTPYPGCQNPHVCPQT